MESLAVIGEDPGIRQLAIVGAGLKLSSRADAEVSQT